MPISFHNYVVNFGSYGYYQQLTTAPNGTVLLEPVPAGQLDRRAVLGLRAVVLPGPAEGLHLRLDHRRPEQHADEQRVHPGPCLQRELRTSAGSPGGARRPTFSGWLGPNSTLPDVQESTGYCPAIYPAMAPLNPPCTAPYTTTQGVVYAARSRHPGGVNSLFCDGSVQFIKNSINLFTWQALCSSQGGEVISSDSY